MGWTTYRRRQTWPHHQKVAAALGRRCAFSDGSASSRVLRVDRASAESLMQACRIISQHRSKPALYLRNRHTFSYGVGLDLIFANRAHGEVVGFFMSEIEPAHRSCGEHRVAFSQSDARRLVNLQ